MSEHKFKYQNFLDTLLKLKELYGSLLFSEERFWGMLTDFYHFPGESVLKEVARECVGKGYVKELADSSDPERTAKRILSAYDSASFEKQEAAAAVMFGIAIALSKATAEDYESYLTDLKIKAGDNTSNAAANAAATPAAPSQKPASKTKTSKSTTTRKRRTTRSRGKASNKLSFWYILLLVLGIVILIGSIYFYSAYLYHDFPIGLIIFCETVVQILYIGLARRAVKDNKSLSDKQKLIFETLLLPIAWSYFLLDFTPLLLMLDVFKENLYIACSPNIGLYNIISDINPTGIIVDFPKTPGFFTFLGTGVSLFAVWTCLKSLIDSKRQYQTSTSSSYPFLSWTSVGIIVLTISGVLADHIEKSNKGKEEYFAENQQLKVLTERRAQETKSLSFQGIALGAPIDTISAPNLTNIENGDDSTDIPLSYDDKVMITWRSQTDMVTNLLYAPHLKDLKSKKPREEEVIENSYTTYSTFFNNKIDIQVIANQGKVGSIIVKPHNFESGVQLFLYFDDIYNLYVEKYGKPTLGMRPDESIGFSTRDPRSRVYYYWKFQNCEIQLSEYYIIYLESAFIERISSHHEKNYKKNLDQRDSIARAKQREDSIKKAQLRKDSLREANHKQNAINEI